MATEVINRTPLNKPAPDFSLPDVVNGTLVTLSKLPLSSALLIMFICRHCPYVVHVREELIRHAYDYQPQGVSFIAISSNDATQYPEDAPDKLQEMAINCKFTFPILYDETQEVAKAYDAQCTPDFFLYNAERKLAYRGRLDNSTPGNNLPITGKDMRSALDAILTGKPITNTQIPSMGCSIKWKKH